MKVNNKPRNYVALALMKRNGAGAHEKTNKAKRASAKRQLYKELKKPPTELGGFLFLGINPENIMLEKLI
jgi:hypothetical protein